MLASGRRLNPKLETQFPSFYCANLGTWLVFIRRTGTSGDGAFWRNQADPIRDFTDGTSNTGWISGGQSYQAFVRGGRQPRHGSNNPRRSAGGTVLAYGVHAPEKLAHTGMGRCQGA